MLGFNLPRIRQKQSTQHVFQGRSGYTMLMVQMAKCPNCGEEVAILPIKCPKCQTDLEACPNCGGSGMHEARAFFGGVGQGDRSEPIVIGQCPMCAGNGAIIKPEVEGEPEEDS
jgi:ribosomal protein L32